MKTLDEKILNILSLHEQDLFPLVPYDLNKIADIEEDNLKKRISEIKHLFIEELKGLKMKRKYIKCTHMDNKCLNCACYDAGYNEKVDQNNTKIDAKIKELEL